MVTPVAKRQAVAHLQAKLGMSERRACRVIAADRSSVRYRGRVHEQPWVSGASFGAGLVIRNAPDAPG